MTQWDGQSSAVCNTPGLRPGTPVPHGGRNFKKSSPPVLFLIEKFLLSLGYDKVFGTNFVNDGKDTFIAKIDGNNNKGDEKVKKLNEWAEKNNFEYEIIKFYSDSLADKPLFDISKKNYWIKNGVKLEGMPPRKTLIDKLFWK